MCRRRHHRGHLLGRERVVVAGDARALRRQVLEEQLQLIADRTVQADLAVGAAAHLDALLEPFLVRGADGDRQRRAQERRLARGLQVGEQVARVLRALVAQVGDPLVAVGLGPHDLVGVLDPAPRDPQRELVGQEAGVERDVDAEGKAFGRCEHQLGARAGKQGALGQRPRHELRLPAHAALRLDAQAAPAVLDVAVGPAQHVAFERREHGLAVALEDERPRLVQAVERGLAGTAAERATHEPLQLDPARGAHVEVARQARVSLVGAHAGRSSSAARSMRRSATETARLSAAHHVPRRLACRLRQIRGDVALGIAQADQDESRRDGVPQAPDVRALRLQVAPAGAVAPVHDAPMLAGLLETRESCDALRRPVHP